MKTAKMLTILVLALGIMVCSANFAGAGPMGTTFTYQGHLYDANYPADGLYDFQFKLYDANSDGDQVGSDVNKPDVETIAAYFTVELDFGSGVFDGNGVWLEIGVRAGELEDPNVYTVLEPRQEVTPTPYALYATAATSLSAADGTPANVVYVDEVGNVGISTMSPGAKLDVAGNQNIRGDLNFSELLSTIGFAKDGWINLNGNLTVTSALSGTIEAGASMELVAGGTMDLQSASPMTLTTPLLDIAAPVNVQSNLSVAGNVGIGTTSPSSKLHVEDDTTGDVIVTIHNQNNAGTERLYFGTSTGSDAGIMVWGSAHATNPGKWRFFNNKTSANYDWVTSGGVRMTLTNDGNVGIGITNPDEKLTVDGTIKSTTSDSSGRGIFGSASATTGTTYGGYFESASTTGCGVRGEATNPTGYLLNYGYGGYFKAHGDYGRGVYGSALGQNGRGVSGYATETGATTNYGGYFTAAGYSGRGVYGYASNTGDVTNYGGYFEAAGTYGRGVYGKTTGTYGKGVYGYATGTYSQGVQGESLGGGGVGVYGYASANDGRGVFGEASGTYGRGVSGKATYSGGIGVVGYSPADGYDFYAEGPGTDYGTSSSIRWKNDVRAIDDPLGKILRLRGVYFNWDVEHGGGHDVGMIAEEVGEVLPEIVEYEPDGKYTSGMDYSKLTPLLVEAVKELKIESDQRDAEKDATIERLRQENLLLSERLVAIETLVADLTALQKRGEL